MELGKVERSGFAAKRAYPGEKGLYIEFFTSQDANNFYAKGVATGSRVEMYDGNTVIMKFSGTPTVVDSP